MASSSKRLKSSLLYRVIESGSSSPNREHLRGISGSGNSSLIMMSIVSLSGMLVKSDFMSKLARNLPVTSSSQISLAKENEERAVYLFLVIGLIMGTK